MIGESGLNADSPDKYPPNAEVGVRHAIWAAIVSCAMNGRALYWEDSFRIYFPNLGIPWLQKYETEELPAAIFVNGVDFSGFQPLTSSGFSGIWGVAVGNEKKRWVGIGMPPASRRTGGCKRRFPNRPPA